MKKIAFVLLFGMAFCYSQAQKVFKGNVDMKATGLMYAFDPVFKKIDPKLLVLRDQYQQKPSKQILMLKKD
jgi:hypothetical protein